MRLDASCEMSLTVDAPTPLVAMLRPRSGVGQFVVSERYELEPFVPVVEYVDGYGNMCQRLTAPQGSFRIRVQATIETADTIAVQPGAPFTPISDVPDSVLQFLLASRYCPSDKTEDAAREFAGNAKPGYDQAEAIRSKIHKQFEYKYGVSNASTGALETLQVRKGVCRDFAHVGISLCRSLRIPARMVVGYLYKLDPMDLHAWFEAFVGGRWYTFDATQPEPRGGRVAVAYGRDAADVAIFTEYGPIEMKKMTVKVDEVRAT
jgi:transglutaminase-like putative cysteine protease